MRHVKYVSVFFAAMIAVSIILSVGAFAQDVVMSKEDIIALTPEWKGERFPDGRPKVSDEILERMKSVDIVRGVKEMALSNWLMMNGRFHTMSPA